MIAGGVAQGLANSKVKAPKDRDLSSEAAQTLQAQMDLAPDVFASTSNQEYGDPAYARLQMDMAREHAPEIRRMMGADAAAQRGNDLDDLARLGPQVTEAWRRANPQQAELMDAMHSRAMADLNRGGQLDPSEERYAQQSARGAWDARGRVRSSPAASAEILNRYGMVQQRQQQAMAQGAGVAGLHSQMMGDPSMAILGRPSNMNTSQQQFRPGQGFNPFDPYAADLYNTNYNANAAARIATSNNRMGIAGGLMSSGGLIAGAGIGTFG